MCHYQIRWTTPSGNSEHDLLRDGVLNELGVNRADIVSSSIQPSISTPTQPFTIGDIHGTGRSLARPGHEMCISGGISFQTNNGNSYQVEELYFKDDGHRRMRDRLFRIFHYNSQVRLTDETGVSRVYEGSNPINEDHIISGAKYIRLEMPPAGNVRAPLNRQVTP